MTSCANTITLTPSRQALAQAHGWLAQQAQQHNWPSRVRFALQLVLDEALNNVIRHGFPADPPPDAVIELTLVSVLPFVHLDIRDNGVAFDPTQQIPGALATNLKEARPGGHGLRLMRHYLHDMTYQYVGGYNYLRLTMDASDTG